MYSISNKINCEKQGTASTEYQILEHQRGQYNQIKTRAVAGSSSLLRAWPCSKA